MPSDEILEAMLRAIRRGAPPDVAAAVAGVDPRTFRRWRQQGRDGIEPYASLEKRIDEAEATQEMGYVSRVRKYGRGDWRASAWLLERSRPNRWGRHEHIEATVKNEEGAGLSDDELVKRLSSYTRSTNEPDDE